MIDLDGVYDPCRPNDRLLLGMRGSISEFELGVLRARMLDAAGAKARRGELRISVPIGYTWHRDYGLGIDPDLRFQEAVRLVFARFRELGSAPGDDRADRRGLQLSTTLGRPNDGVLRLGADPLQERDLDSQKTPSTRVHTPMVKARSGP